MPKIVLFWIRYLEFGVYHNWFRVIFIPHSAIPARRQAGEIRNFDYPNLPVT
jgi:hypothetical protein